MYSLIFFIVFIALCLAQYIFFIWKRNEVRYFQKVGNDVVNLTGANKHHVYKKSIRIIGNVLNNFKSLLIIPLIVLLVINLLSSLIIATILHLIVGLF